MTKKQESELDKLLESIKKVNDSIGDLRESQKETDKQIAEMSKNMDFSELRESQVKTDKQIAELTKNINGVSRSIGEDAEIFFYTSLQKDPKLGNINFDFVDKNLFRRIKGEDLQIDVFMENGKSVGLVEVKNKVTKKTLKQVEKQMQDFKKFHPAFNDYKVYGAIAGKIFPENLQQEALKKGYFVLVQQGDHVEISSPKM